MADEEQPKEKLADKETEQEDGDDTDAEVHFHTLKTGEAVVVVTPAPRFTALQLGGARDALIGLFVLLAFGFVALALPLGLFDRATRGGGRYVLVNLVVVMLVVAGLFALAAAVFIALVEQRRMRVQIVTGPPPTATDKHRHVGELTKYGLPASPALAEAAFTAVGSIASALKSARSSTAAFVVAAALFITAGVVAAATTPETKPPPAPTTTTTSQGGQASD